MKRNNKKRHSSLNPLIFVLIICLSFQNIESYVNRINKHNSFFILSDKPEGSFPTQQYRLCFNNISSRSTYINLMESSIDNLSAYINSDTVSLHLITNTETDVAKNKDLNFIDSYIKPDYNSSIIAFKLKNSVVINMTIDSNTYYCLSFKTIQAITSFKNLKLYTSSSYKEDQMTYESIYNFSAFTNYNAQSSDALSIYSAEYSLTEANLSDSFNANLNLETSIAVSKEILTKNFMEIYLHISNIDVSQSTITSNQVGEEALQLAIKDFDSEIINYSENSNNLLTYDSSNPHTNISVIKLSNLSENLVNKRKFQLVLSKLAFIQYSSVNSTIKVEIRWKNTNSVISTSTFNLTVNCIKYVFDQTVTQIRHINNYKYLYTNSAFPMEVSVKLNESTTNNLIITSSNKSQIQFIPSTCEFYLTTSYNSFCVEDTSNTDSSTSIMIVKTPKIIKNSTYTLRVWMIVKDFADNFKISVSVENFSEVYTLSSSKLPSFVFALDNNLQYGLPNFCYDNTNKYLTTCSTCTTQANASCTTDLIYQCILGLETCATVDFSACTTIFNGTCKDSCKKVSHCVEQKECLLNNDTNCTKDLLYINEITSGFYLLNDNREANGFDNLSGSKLKLQYMIKLNQDLTNPSRRLNDDSFENNNTRLLEETNIPYYQAYLWQLEIGSDVKENLSSLSTTKMIQGYHNFYFPVDFTKVAFSISNTDLLWYSNYYYQLLNAEASDANIGYNYSSYNSPNESSPRLISDNKITLSASTIDSTNNNIISFDNYNSSGINLGLYYHLIMNFDKTNNNAEVSLSTSDPTKKHLSYTGTDTSYVENTLEFDFVSLQSVDIKSKFASFDLIHTFTRRGESKPCRVNRFISLLPQRGLFSSNTSTLSSTPIVFYTYGNHFLGPDLGLVSLCLVELSFSSLADEDKLSSNNLIIFLKRESNSNNIFLDVDNMLNYPISNGTAKAYNSLLNYEYSDYYHNRYFKNAYTGTETGIANYIETMTSYFYLESRIEISTINFNNSIVFPAICNDKSKISHSVTSYQNSNNIYSRNKKVFDYSLFSVTSNFQLDNSVQSDLSLESNGEQKLTITNKSSSFTLLNNDVKNGKYILLLTNYDVNSQDIAFLNQDFDSANTLFQYKDSANNAYAAFSMSGNTITYNNFTYKNIYFLYKISTDLSFIFNTIIEGNSRAAVNISGIDVSLKNGVKKSTDTGNPDFLYNFVFYITENNVANIFGQGLNVVNPATKTDISSVLSASITTNKIKTPTQNNAYNYICGRLNIQIDNDTTTINVYSSSFSESTIMKPENFEGSGSAHAGYISFSIAYSTTKSIKISICNMYYDNNLFKVTKLEILSSTHFTAIYENTETPVIAGSALSSEEYTSDYISTYSYSNSRATFNDLTLTVALDHEVFRNMRISISFDSDDNIITNKLLISDDLGIQCEAFFSDSSELNAVFETCKVDLSNNEIIITTVNDVVINDGSMLSSFTLLLFPVYRYELNTTSFSVNTSFNIDPYTAMFAMNSSTPTLSSTSEVYDDIKTYVINSSITFETITPEIPGLIGKVKININLVDNNSVLTYLEENNSPSINETAFYFPYEFYGTLSDTYTCYLNSNVITNCVYENNWLYIRSTVSLYDINEFEIYGFVIQDMTNFNYSKSKFLVQINTLTTDSRVSWLEGVGAINSNFSFATYTLPKTEYINLALTSQLSSVNYPNSITNITVNYVQDRLTGLESTEIDYTDISNTQIYVQIPKELEFTSTSTLQLYYYYASDSAASTNSETETTNGAETITENSTEKIYRVELTLDNISHYGHLIVGKITSSISISETFRSFSIIIKNLRTPINETKIGIFDVVFYREDLYFSTFPILYNNNIEFNNKSIIELEFSSKNSNSKTSTEMSKYEIDYSFYYIEYFRSLVYSYETNKYYFSYSSTLTYNITPGAYKEIFIFLNKRGSVSDLSASTSISIDTNYENVFSIPDNSEFTVDGTKKTSVVFKAGIPCGTLPGTYILHLTHSDTINQYFSPFTPITFTNKHQLIKTQINFYNSYKTIYKSTSSISIAKGGRVFFYLQAESPSMNKLTVSFSASNSNTTINPPNTIDIPINNTQYIISSFSSTNANVDTAQKYTITVSGSTCFASSVSTISFLPNYEIEKIDNNLDLKSIISFYTKDSVTNNSLLRNQIKFDFDGRILELPNGSYLFCSLYCANHEAPDENTLTSLPYIEDTWDLNFYSTEVTTNTLYSYVFDNLVRDLDYKLKCILESSEYLEENRSSVSVDISSIGGIDIRASPTQELSCIQIYVNELVDGFENAAMKVIQNVFSTNYEENGCINVINSKGNSIEGLLNTSDYKCESSSYTTTDTADTSSNSTETNSSSTSSEADITISTTTSTLRYLQSENSSDITSDTSTEESSSSEDSSVEETYSYELCLIQAPTCGYDVNTVTLSTNLKNLFLKTTTTTANRRLNSINNINTNKISKSINNDKRELSTSSFYSSLPVDYRSYYKSYEIVNLDSSLISTYQSSIEVINNSSFSETKSKTITISVALQSTEYGNKLNCAIAITPMPIESAEVPNKSQILECVDSLTSSSTTNTTAYSSNISFCYSSNISSNTKIEKTISSSSFYEYESFSVWAVCKQNIYIAKEYGDATSLKTFSYILDEYKEVIDSSLCIDGNASFPNCCENGIDKENITICAVSSFALNINISIIMIILYLVGFLLM